MAIGYVLSQVVNDNKEHVIAYMGLESFPMLKKYRIAGFLAGL